MFLVVLSALLLSFNGLIFRTIAEATAWQVIFYRSAALAAAMVGLFVMRHRRRWFVEWRHARRGAWIAGPFLGLASVSFIMSISLTTVANALFTLSAVPLFAAALAWVVLSERVRPATWIAIVVAMSGVGLMVFDGVTLGGAVLAGNLLALATAVFFACFVVALRYSRHADMMPAVCIGALVAMAISGVMAGNLEISTRDLAICVAWGALLSSVAQAIFTIASRHVAAAEMTLLSQAEVIAGPIWVWLIFGETPTAYTLMGGAVVAAAIVGWIISIRRQSNTRSN